jgi:succinate-semialdehyde dehydrogenase / glutarate-semialdehyde dehydrogenase
LTADPEHGRRLAGRLDSGMLFVNRLSYTLPQLPFGGVKNSGFGRELSQPGIGEFVNRKLVNVFPSTPREPVPAAPCARGALALSLGGARPAMTCVQPVG